MVKNQRENVAFGWKKLPGCRGKTHEDAIRRSFERHVYFSFPGHENVDLSKSYIGRSC